MAYEHFFTNAPIAKEVSYNGRTETVYFKKLTTGQRMALQKGQRGEVQDGKLTYELSFDEITAMNHQKVYFSNCNENGKRIFNSAKEVAELEDGFFEVLIAACNAALGETENPTT
jgi:hypothetical protein